MHFRLPLAIVAAAFLVACQTPPPTPEQRQADMCRTFRGYLSTQPMSAVQESCTRQLGEAACRECLR